MNTRSLRGFLVRETLVSGVISMVLSIAVAWLIFHATAPVGLWGAHGVAADLFISSFAIGLLMTAALTLVMRLHQANGRAPKLPTGRVSPFSAWLAKRKLPVRALLLGLLTMATMAPVLLSILLLLAIVNFELPGLLLGKAMQGLIIGLVLTPVIIFAVLGEGAKRAEGPQGMT